MVRTAVRWREARARYAADLGAGSARFFEPRRASCPWCGSGPLRLRLVTRDLVQGKPGRFTLEECAACGHVFQNPRLSRAGLEFYYRDVYDGYAARSRQAFSLKAVVYMLSWRQNAGRVALVTAATRQPTAWLDVGAGYGNLCAEARTSLPDTAFDGLDQSDGVLHAERKGLIRRGLRGQLTELADTLTGRYDVVSMVHYLEHTPDPAAEIRAAWQVLAPDGLLLIEVPNPDSRFSRLLGEWWVGWVPPQHLHMFPPRNLVQALPELGFRPIRVELGAANMPNDLLVAVLNVADSVVPDPRPPWRPPTAVRSRLWRRRAAMVAVVPLALLALLADHACHLWIRRGRGGNAYRVLARRIEPR